jgi:hypothetical protein
MEGLQATQGRCYPGSEAKTSAKLPAVSTRRAHARKVSASASSSLAAMSGGQLAHALQQLLAKHLPIAKLDALLDAFFDPFGPGTAASQASNRARQPRRAWSCAGLFGGPPRRCYGDSAEKTSARLPAVSTRRPHARNVSASASSSLIVTSAGSSPKRCCS